MNICGPMANGDLALAFHFQYFRYPVAEFVGSTSKKATIPVFKRVFDTYGVSKEINRITVHLSTAINLKNTHKKKGSSTEKSHQGGLKPTAT